MHPLPDYQELRNAIGLLSGWSRGKRRWQSASLGGLRRRNLGTCRSNASAACGLNADRLTLRDMDAHVTHPLPLLKAAAYTRLDATLSNRAASFIIASSSRNDEIKLATYNFILFRPAACSRLEATVRFWVLAQETNGTHRKKKKMGVNGTPTKVISDLWSCSERLRSQHVCVGTACHPDNER